MLWLAQPTRRRFTLQVRTSGQKLQVWDASTGAWDNECFTAVAPTAIVRLEQGGRTFDFRSRNGFSQRVLFFDAVDGHSVGTIEVNASGAFMIRKGVEGAWIIRKWPALWTTQTVAIVKVRAPLEIIVTDRLGAKEGTIAYELRHTTWHVPGTFWEKTRNYDTGDEGDDVRVDPVVVATGLRPTFGMCANE